jgi:fatty acid desaturase
MTSLTNADPRAARSVLPASWAAALLDDPRDAPFLELILVCLALIPCAVSLFFAGPAFWYLAAGYWVLVWVLAFDRFILMLHCTSHRPLFAPRWRRLNLLIPWVIGPFFGQTPNSYFVHHMGMHHREENLPEDSSSTMKYRRDRVDHWLRYVGRFLLIGLVDLARYHLRRNNRRLLARLVRGEVVFWLAVAALLYFDPRATLVVLVAPLLLARVLMMTGNWGQHAFICPSDAGDAFKNSITCIDTRYNRRCFNDGYHIDHHRSPRRHWTEYPAELDENRAQYGAADAIVFRGIDFFGVWVCLMFRRWRVLARAYVPLPGAPARSEEELIAFLKQRVQPIAPA